MKRILLIAVIFQLSSVNIFAQTTYSLQQCIEYALKNHRSIKKAQNDVGSAIARKNEGRAGYLPQVNAQAKWDDNLILQKTALPEEFANALGSKEVAFGTHYSTMAAIQLDQTVVNWSLIEGIRALKPNEQLVKLQKAKTEEDVVYNTIAAYYNILLISENEKLLKQNEDRLSKTLPIVKLQFDKGVIKKMDVDRIQVNYNNIISNEQILASKKNVAYNNLKYNMAMPLDSVITIDTAYSKEIITDLKNYTDTSNVRNRLDLQVLRQSLLLNQINYNRTKAGYYPTLGFYAKYGGQALGDKFKQSFTDWSQFAAIGFRIDVPIFDGLRNSSALKQMGFTIASLKETIAQTEEGLKLQMYNANTDLSTSVSNLTSNKETLDLAESIYNTTTLQYQKGIIGYTDLLSAEYSYKESESNYLQSLVKYLNSKLDADKSNNNLGLYSTPNLNKN